LDVLQHFIYDIPKSVVTDDEFGVCSRATFSRAEKCFLEGRECGQTGRPSILNESQAYELMKKVRSERKNNKWVTASCLRKWVCLFNVFKCNRRWKFVMGIIMILK
jgi:hypothetical protein